MEQLINNYIDNKRALLEAFNVDVENNIGVSLDDERQLYWYVKEGKIYHTYVEDDLYKDPWSENVFTISKSDKYSLAKTQDTDGDLFFLILSNDNRRYID